MKPNKLFKNQSLEFEELLDYNMQLPIENDKVSDICIETSNKLDSNKIAMESRKSILRKYFHELKAEHSKKKIDENEPKLKKIVQEVEESKFEEKISKVKDSETQLAGLMLPANPF